MNHLDLNNISKEYKIFVDTCVLMHFKAAIFFNVIKKHLLQNDSKLLYHKSVEYQLLGIKKGGEKKEDVKKYGLPKAKIIAENKAKYATKGLEFIKEFIKKGCGQAFIFYGLCRYRVNRKDLPGKPDIVIEKYKLVIQVHGCYWHRHKGCKLAYNPKSRVDFWQNKFSENISRDKKVEKALVSLGYRVYTIWECEARNMKSLRDRIHLILSGII